MAVTDDGLNSGARRRTLSLVAGCKYDATSLHHPGADLDLRRARVAVFRVPTRWFARLLDLHSRESSCGKCRVLSTLVPSVASHGGFSPVSRSQAISAQSGLCSGGRCSHRHPRKTGRAQTPGAGSPRAGDTDRPRPAAGADHRAGPFVGNRRVARSAAQPSGRALRRADEQPRPRHPSPG